MGRSKEVEELQKHTLNLYKGDFEKLQMFYEKVGAGKMIREIVRAHIHKVETRAEQLMPAMPTEAA